MEARRESQGSESGYYFDAGQASDMSGPGPPPTQTHPERTMRLLMFY